MKPPRKPDAMTERGLQMHLEQMSKVMSNLSFGSTMSNADAGQNMECWKASGNTPGVANTEFAIAHGLGRIPLTLAGWDTNNGGVLYRSTTAWTATTAYLKCTTATAAYNVVLI